MFHHFLLLVFIYDSMNLVSPRKDGEPSLEQLMKSLKSNIDSRRGKNVDILLISEEVKLIILCLFSIFYFPRASTCGNNEN